MSSNATQVLTCTYKINHRERPRPENLAVIKMLRWLNSTGGKARKPLKKGTVTARTTNKS